MTNRQPIGRMICIAAGMALFVFGPALSADESSADEKIIRVYSMDVVLFSFQPDEGIKSYRSHGAGSASGGGTLGLGVRENDRDFRVSIRGTLKSHRFWAVVNVEPSKRDTHTEAQEHEWDLSDLRPRALDVARDGDGRIYRLNLMPSVSIEDLTPKTFRANDLRLENWGFPQSPVILNDQQYLGQLAMSSSPLAWLDIPGLALVEFSLFHLTDAKPLGLLRDGVVEITHEDGTSLKISGVKNGVHRQVLEGGPYQVWVRWKDPTRTVDESRESARASLARLREQIRAGELALPRRSLERLERFAESDRAWFLTSGLRGVRPDEIVTSDD